MRFLAVLGAFVVASSPWPSAADPPGSGCRVEQARIGELEQALERCTPSGDWSQLRRGQSRSEVLRILGDPGKVAVYAGFERWEYPDLRGGRIHFDENGRARSWRPPAHTAQ